VTPGRRIRLSALCLLAVLGAGACVEIGAPGRIPTQQRSGPDIIVGSFDFSESALLAELFATMLEERGYPVRRMSQLGAREIVLPALRQGRVDLVPEYLGTALGFVTLGDGNAVSDPAAMRRRLAARLAPEDVTVLDIAPAQNQNGVVVTRATADRFGLRTISDLRGVAARLSFGGPPECAERPLCLPGLRSRYGLRFERFVPLDPGGPTTVAALDEGLIDVGLLFTTDPQLNGDDLVLLRDDRELQPPENIVPIVRSSVLRRFGTGIRDALDDLTERLTTSSLRTLNHMVEVRGQRPREVATLWLTAQELVR
jgi:osmoprotectant transport system substrate-binding protein